MGKGQSTLKQPHQRTWPGRHATSHLAEHSKLGLAKGKSRMASGSRCDDFQQLYETMTPIEVSASIPAAGLASAKYSPRCIGVDPQSVLPQFESSGYIAQLTFPADVHDARPGKEVLKLRKTALDEIRGDESAATQKKRGRSQSAVYPGLQAVPQPSKGAVRRPHTAHPRLSPVFKRELWPGTPTVDSPIGNSIASSDCARYAPVRFGSSAVRLQRLCAHEAGKQEIARPASSLA